MYSVLSLFPDLFLFSFYAPTLLRVAVAIILISIGLKKFKGEAVLTPKKLIACIEIVASILLLIGLYTQGAVIILLISVSSGFLQREQPASETEKYFTFLVAAILASLLVTGPGAFSIDFPF